MIDLRLLSLCCAGLLAGCAAQAVPSPDIGRSGAAAPAAENSPSKRLETLFRASDEGSLNRAPLNALFRNDPRNADQFGDYVTDEYFAKERAALEAELATLLSIDRSALSREEQIAYDVFKWKHESELRGYRPEILAATVVRPINHHTGFHIMMSDISSGSSVVQFKTIGDYENNLKRLEDYTRYLDRSIGRMREGLQTGVVQPKIVSAKLISQMDNLLQLGVEGSPFYGPVARFPEGVTAAEQARLKARYAGFIRDKLLPAHKRLKDFLEQEYLPKSRPSVGLSEMPGGANLYDHLIEANTTMRMSAEEIHQMGLAEVARINSEIQKVKDRVEFKGSPAEFAEHMRSNPKFQPKSAEEIRQRYLEIEKKVNARIGELFPQFPKTRLQIRAMPEQLGKSAGNAFYAQGAPDGSRPGIFNFNAHNLPSRITYDAETLFLHEGNPGHHYQISLAQENDKLPNFLRFGGNTAFGEGWGLYAESLGPELGLFTDPYQYYGRLTNEMLRAARLVVDTGIHAKGWSREEAIKYMVDNTAYSKAMLTTEVDRYIANPGQALAYKIGELTIRRLRTEAQRALARRFDVREFHAEVLGTGSLPMPILEAKIGRWIKSKGGS